MWIYAQLIIPNMPVNWKILVYVGSSFNVVEVFENLSYFRNMGTNRGYDL